MSEPRYTISPHSSEFELSPRWVCVYFNKQLIAESKNMMLEGTEHKHGIRKSGL